MAVGESPRVSVIVPSYGRPEILDDCISKLLEQTYTDFEILVVHDGPGCPEYDDRRVIVNHSDRPRGSPAAKNRGIQQSSGDIIVFIDDDSVPISNEWIREYVEAFKVSEADIGGIGGYIDENQPFDEAEGTGCINRNRFGFYRIVSGFQADTELEVAHLKSCNFAVRRRVFDELDTPYFDPRFEGNAHREETDFTVRIRDAGYRLRYTPTCGVIHKHAETGGQRGLVSGRWASAFWSGKNESLFFYKHFHSGWRSTVSFVIQEAVHNRLLPWYQVPKIAGVVSGIFAHRGTT